MDPQSPYLVQALQNLGQRPTLAQGPQIDPQQLATFLKQRQAYQVANPGQSYIGHNLAQAGTNIMGAPGRVMGGLQSVPGNVMGALRGIPGTFGLK